MKLTRLVPGSIGSNCYILIDGECAVVIDPSANAAEIMNVIENAGARLTAILLTHGHFDHILGLERLRAANPEAPVMIHADDAELLSDGHKNAFYDFFKRDRDFGTADKLLIEGDIINVGNAKIKTIHTPGHTKGSACYRVGNILFSGDTIMADSYGRCDLYSGNPLRMNTTLAKIRALPNAAQITIYPGHGAAAKLSDAIYKIFSD